jgi:hypothetical protein
LEALSINAKKSSNLLVSVRLKPKTFNLGMSKVKTLFFTVLNTIEVRSLFRCQ